MQSANTWPRLDSTPSPPQPVSLAQPRRLWTNITISQTLHLTLRCVKGAFPKREPAASAQLALTSSTACNLPVLWRVKTKPAARLCESLLSLLPNSTHQWVWPLAPYLPTIVTQRISRHPKWRKDLTQTWENIQSVEVTVSRMYSSQRTSSSTSLRRWPREHLTAASSRSKAWLQTLHLFKW